MRTPLTGLSIAIALLGAAGCEQPPPGRVYPDPADASAPDDPDAEPITVAAHREAYLRLLDDAIDPLARANPIAAAQLGRASLAAAPVSLIDRQALGDAIAKVLSEASEIDEHALAPDQVVVIRTVRFGLGRIQDDVQRRPGVRIDPLTAVRAFEALAAEIEWQWMLGRCEGCSSAMAGLGDTLTSAHQQLAASSLSSARDAAQRARALATRLRKLAEASKLPNLDTAATALDAHASELDALAQHLPDAKTAEWAGDPPLRLGGPETIHRLPPALGERALSRMLSAEERIDTPASRLWSQTRQHVGRWQRLRAELVPADLPADAPAPVDAARCNAARDRLSVALSRLPDIEPTTLDCERWTGLHADAPMSEGELVLALLDLGWIEPQRRRLRAEELPSVALVTGQWSADVHLHLRRVMLLAQLDEKPALARALDEGRAALCLASASVWVHAALGPVDELGMTLGSECESLGDGAKVQARVIADPRGSLAALGLSMIGDEPAAMAGFDRFWWAPLGQMRLLATPAGEHPDKFRLPSEEAADAEQQLEFKVEDIDANMALESESEAGSQPDPASTSGA